MTISADILLIGFNAVNSQLDAYRILKHKKIAHGINFGAYLILVGVTIYLYQMNPARSIVFSIGALCNRQITFDIPLNLRRKLKWFHVSTAKPPKAILDRIEIWAVGYNGKLLVLIYSIGWILSLLIFYLWPNLQ